MVQSKAQTVSQYLQKLPSDRRKDIEAVRKVILKNLPKGYEEGMQYGMIGYYVPLKLYPKGYAHDGKTPLPYASLASQKNYMVVYHMGLYSRSGGEKWIRDEFKKAGKKLDMGKSCIRFKKLKDLPLDVIGRAIAMIPAKETMAMYDQYMTARKTGRKNK
ncbi:MAG: DUF1801 domain-containing protein [bacterium]|nr:DUF1801 domain-containing protein [bacterium]